MISIFIMYSSDRAEQLAQTVKYLRKMEFYDSCQKTIVADGKANVIPDDFQVIQVPRFEGEFVWSDMWRAGVFTAKFETILYLDSDRLLPANYLKLVLDNISDGKFLFTSHHFMVLNSLTDEECDHLLNCSINEVADSKYLGKLKFEPRYKYPFSGPGKNVMSGNTAFTKSTYSRLGGVDRWYRGHGAYADTDFHMTAGKAGCEFVDLGVTELHCHHSKIEGRSVLTKEELDKMGLDNFIYYCHKWEVPTNIPENLAFRCRIPKPALYVSEKLKEYATEVC